jgi:hypothetical protein
MKGTDRKQNSVENSFCAAAIKIGEEDSYSILSSDDKIILFDSLEIARNTIPYLAEGRRYFWNEEKDILKFSPYLIGYINEINIILGYDPFLAPYGKSETRLMPWKNHIMWNYVFSGEE